MPDVSTTYMEITVRERLKEVLLETFLLPHSKIDKHTRLYLDEQAETLIANLKAAGLKVEIDDSIR